jgi:hypothetical protein
MSVRNREIAARPPKANTSKEDKALSELESIFTKLRTLFVSEYRRGNANAASRILNLVSSSDQEDGITSLTSGPALKRAPRGAARVLVEKSLADGAKTIKEIRDGAVTDVEKFLSYQTVRLELERGKAVKRYKKVKDKWYIS